MIVIIVIAALVILWLAAKPKKKAPSYVASPVIPAVLEWEQKEREKAAREAARAEREAEKQRKAEAERQQAANDSEFYVEQIDKLYSMLWELDADLDKAREVCRYDNEMNKHGAVIAEKIVNKHRADRDKLARKVMQLENAIHAKEAKLNKARLVAGA